MHNGYQIDPQALMLETLFDLKESNGRIEQRLDDGKEFHHEVREFRQEVRDTLKDYGGRITVLESQKSEGSFSTALDWIERLYRIWPALFLLTSIAIAIATSLGVHVPDGVKEVMKHSPAE
jgi:hypothetical protein